MIKKLTKQMLLAQVLSVLTTSICMLVDSLVIGRCLGVGAVAAYGLSSPILLIIGGKAQSSRPGCRLPAANQSEKAR
ncbi:MAG: hypothetical protein J5599_08260 [Spirochaetales bacterium]|nr:hypothetical protein [Spirochaetales bacterium]